MSAVTLKLIEADVQLIQDHLKTNMPQALADISADREKSVGQLAPPREYFTYDTANANQTPCIFIIGQAQDFRIYDKQANFVDALSRIFTTVVVEGQAAPDLQYTAYRYQAAMVKLLSQTELQTSDGSVSIRIKVVRSRFSETYTTAQVRGNATGVFRKEVLLELDVEHYENLFS